MPEVELTIRPNGTIQSIYSDDAIELLRELGDPKIERASHVEPDENGKWIADLSPVNGPCLGPFDFRQEALEAETAWLRKFYLGGANHESKVDAQEGQEELEEKEG